jgi:predicted RNA-binding protein with RPS1 domain
LHQLSSEEYSVVQSNLEKIVIGNVYSGTIVNATNFGVFVYLEAADRQGLIHKSSLGKFSSNNPLKDGIWIPGSQVLVSVDVIDFQKLRLGLSLVSNDDEAL